MIFVTVGHQMPFERLIRAVDRWAGATGRSDVFAQIGDAQEEPQHITWARFLEPADFRAKIELAHALVAHAGTGSILTALELGKPILVMPRRADLHETRNDHQLATAQRFREKAGVLVAETELELAQRIAELETLAGVDRIGREATPELLAAVRGFIDRG